MLAKKLQAVIDEEDEDEEEEEVTEAPQKVGSVTSLSDGALSKYGTL